MESELNHDEAASQQNKQDDAPLENCLREVAEWKDKYLHLNADFQNFKRRQEKDQAAWRHAIKVSFLGDLLAIIDNVDRAMAEAEKAQDDTRAWFEGFVMIQKQMKKFLDTHGVKEIEVSETFDPHLHEALMHVESKDHKSGTVVQVLQKGYMLNDKVLRPAHVSIAQ